MNSPYSHLQIFYRRERSIKGSTKKMETMKKQKCSSRIEESGDIPLLYFTPETVCNSLILPKWNAFNPFYFGLLKWRCFDWNLLKHLIIKIFQPGLFAFIEWIIRTLNSFNCGKRKKRQLRWIRAQCVQAMRMKQWQKKTNKYLRISDEHRDKELA